MLSKSLIEFSVDGWGCVPSLLFDLGPNYVEVMKIMVTSFKRNFCKFFLDVRLGLSHKACIYQLLIFRGFRIKRGEARKASFT